MDLTASLHVPAVVRAVEAGGRDFHPPDVDAAVVSEAASGSFGDGGGSCGIHHVEEGFVGVVKTLGSALVVGVLVTGQGFAFVKDVEMVAGCVGEGEVSGVRAVDAEQDGGQQEGRWGFHRGEHGSVSWRA